MKISVRNRRLGGRGKHLSAGWCEKMRKQSVGSKLTGKPNEMENIQNDDFLDNSIQLSLMLC